MWLARKASAVFRGSGAAATTPPENAATDVRRARGVRRFPRPLHALPKALRPSATQRWPRALPCRSKSRACCRWKGMTVRRAQRYRFGAEPSSRGKGGGAAAGNGVGVVARRVAGRRVAPQKYPNTAPISASLQKIPRDPRRFRRASKKSRETLADFGGPISEFSKASPISAARFRNFPMPRRFRRAPFRVFQGLADFGGPISEFSKASPISAGLFGNFLKARRNRRRGSRFFRGPTPPGPTGGCGGARCHRSLRRRRVAAFVHSQRRFSRIRAELAYHR